MDEALVAGCYAEAVEWAEDAIRFVA